MRSIASSFRRHGVRWLFLMLLIIVAGGALFVLLTENAPESSSVRVMPCLERDGECLRFPLVNGTNLLGELLSLPIDLTGEFRFIVMPFDEQQQIRAAEWLPIAEELAAQHPDLAYYDVSVLPAVNPLVRTLITGGMAAIISDEALRGISIMLFLDDLDLFLSALAIHDRDAIQLFLLNSDGEVLWRATGDYTPETAASLAAALTRN